MAVRFERLAERLRKVTPGSITLTLDEIEDIIGGPLAPGYFKDGSFVYSGSPLLKAARNAGFEVANAVLSTNRIGSVTFSKSRLLSARTGSLVSFGGPVGATKSSKKANESSRKDGKATFAKCPISDSDALAFFHFLIKQLYDEAALKGYSTSVHSHFLKSDYDLLDPGKALSVQSFIFKELAYHAQNSQLNNTVMFSPSKSPSAAAHIAWVTNSFNPSVPLRSQSDFLSCPLYSSMGPGQIDSLKRYYACLEDIRSFMDGKTTVASVDAALTGPLSTPILNKTLYKQFTTLFKHCYGVALTFDFLKEFGKAFEIGKFDYPKPDRHIRRTMVWLYNSTANMALCTGGKGRISSDSISEFLSMELCDELKESIRREYVCRGGSHVLAKKITNYVLDKAIYILASGNYYLGSEKKDGKIGNRYYDALAKGEYKLTPVNIKFLDTFLSRI